MPDYIIQKCFLVGISLDDTNEADLSMDELKELVKTAGGEVCGYSIQKRNSIDPKICIGSGKLLEIKDYMEENDIDLAVFDIELSPSQINNIGRILDKNIIDRTILILDIFAQRAKTSEGKLEVELAQLKHRYNSLKGKGVELSRLGGGIGTRGPGETKLETDKRHIRRRIDKLEENIEKISKHRSELRKNRVSKQYKTVSLVGYTNAGKSTLLNALTNSDVYVKDQLFATLDATSRALSLSKDKTVILVDTVGFIRNLPHFLINAFKATLEEVVLSDLVLLVCDISDDNYPKQIDITEKILEELHYTGKIIKVFNKCDKIDYIPSEGIVISATEKIGFNELKQKISNELFPKEFIIKVKIPYEKAALIQDLRRRGKIISEVYNDFDEILEISVDYSESLLYYDYKAN